jgi:hypothetical protein
VPDRSDAHLLQIVRRKLRQDCPVHRVLVERRLVFAEAKAVQPGRYVH